MAKPSGNLLCTQCSTGVASERGKATVSQYQDKVRLLPSTCRNHLQLGLHWNSSTKRRTACGWQGQEVSEALENVAEPGCVWPLCAEAYENVPYLRNPHLLQRQLLLNLGEGRRQVG